MLCVVCVMCGVVCGVVYGVLLGENCDKNIR